ncbi:MAG: ribonuclease HI [Bacteroidales bacterium]
MIELYTDGSSRGNPGAGGWAAILRSGKHYKELSGGFVCTTNNRMELLAVIKGLEAIKLERANVKVWSDSLYVCNAINQGWLFKWERSGLDKKKNPDLWRRFLPLYRRHNVKFHWIKGHSGHPMNERCDTLAVEAALSGDLSVDEGYMECNLDSSTTTQNLPL